MGKGDETRLAILDQAVAVTRRVGLGGLTIGSLADQAQLSKSGLYAHFRSKEALQLAVLEHARASFEDLVARPAVRKPRGEPRIRELFERWLWWDTLPGGCPFVAASAEFDDQPGVVRDRLVRDQLDSLDMVATIVRSGVAEGHFRADVDPEQFAHDFNGLTLAHHFAHRLLGDPKAEARARHAFEALLDSVRVPTQS